MSSSKVLGMCVASAFLSMQVVVAQAPVKDIEMASSACAAVDEECLRQISETPLNPCEGIENCMVAEPAPERIYPSCSVSEPPCTVD